MENLIEKYGKNKIFKIFFIVLFALLIMVCIFRNASYKTYDYKGHRLKLQKVSDYMVTMEDKDKNVLKMSIDLSKSYQYNFKCNVSYLDESISYEDSFENMEFMMTFSDGTKKTMPSYIIQIDEDDADGLTKNQRIEKDLIFKLKDYYIDNKFTLYISIAIFGGLFILLGVSLFVYPESYWRMQTWLMVKDGEPTEFAIVSNQILGIVIIIMAFIVPFLL